MIYRRSISDIFRTVGPNWRHFPSQGGLLYYRNHTAIIGLRPEWACSSEDRAVVS